MHVHVLANLVDILILLINHVSFVHHPVASVQGKLYLNVLNVNKVISCHLIPKVHAISAV